MDGPEVCVTYNYTFQAKLIMAAVFQRFARFEAANLAAIIDIKTEVQSEALLTHFDEYILTM